MTAPDRTPAAPADPVGAGLIRVGLAGLVLGLSGMIMLLAGPVVGLGRYGLLLVVLGLAQAVELAWNRRGAARTGRALLSLIYLGCGAGLMLAPPVLAGQTRLVVALLCAAGAFRIVWSVTWPWAPRLWGVVAGLATIAMGLALLAGWARESVWVLGLAIAVDLSLYGTTAFLLGRGLRAGSGSSPSSPSTSSM